MPVGPLSACLFATVRVAEPKKPHRASRFPTQHRILTESITIKGISRFIFFFASGLGGEGTERKGNTALVTRKIQPELL
jgi:hypothetical protein